MTSRKYYFVLLAIFLLLLGGIIAGALGGNMLLEKQSSKLSALKAENESIELQQNALIRAKKDVERYGEIDEIAKSVVPQDKDQAKTVREIVQIANEHGVPIKSVTFPASDLGKTAPTTEGGSTAGSAEKQPAISQVKPVKGIAGVYFLEIQVDSAGEVPYQNFLNFLEGLEKNRRTAHVNNINLEPSKDGSSLNFNLTLNAYVKP